MDRKAKNRLLGIAMLITATMIWGGAFVAQKVAMDNIGSLTMNGLRALLAAFFLFPIALVFDKLKGKKVTLLGTTEREGKKNMLLGGLFCGIVITIASTFQQYGIDETSVGKSGFLTTLYIILVPIFGLFLGKKVDLKGWIAVLIALVGMFFICKPDGGEFNKGDLLVIISAAFFAIHILIIDKYTKIVDGIRLSCFQFLICGTICTISALIIEKPEIEDIAAAWFPIFYAGVLSAGVGYTLQILAQKWVEPHITPLFMSLESVFSVIAGAIFIEERLTPLVYLGFVFMFAAILLSQINFKKKDKFADAKGADIAIDGNNCDNCNENDFDTDKKCDEKLNFSSLGDGIHKNKEEYIEGKIDRNIEGGNEKNSTDFADENSAEDECR